MHFACFACTLLCSLGDNNIGPEGGSALAAILSQTKITDLKWASTSNPGHIAFAFLSAPLDTPQSPCSQLAGQQSQRRRQAGDQTANGSTANAGSLASAGWKVYPQAVAGNRPEVGSLGDRGRVRVRVSRQQSTTPRCTSCYEIGNGDTREGIAEAPKSRLGRESRAKEAHDVCKRRARTRGDGEGSASQRLARLAVEKENAARA